MAPRTRWCRSKKASRPKRRTPRSLTLTNIQKGSNQLTKNHIDSGVWSDGFRLLKCAHTHTHTPTTTTTTTSWQKNKTLSKDKQKRFHTLCAAAPTKLNNWKKPRAVRNGWRSCSKTHEHHSRQVGERELLGCGRLSWLASPVNPVDSWRRLHRCPTVYLNQPLALGARSVKNGQQPPNRQSRFTVFLQLETSIEQLLWWIDCGLCPWWIPLQMASLPAWECCTYVGSSSKSGYCKGGRNRIGQ